MTHEERKRIVRLSRQGKTQREIAAVLGVNRSSVRDVLREHERHLHKLHGGPRP